MAHDHSEKIHTCKKCGYWHVANGRFDTCNCKGCGKRIAGYASREWIIENIDKKFEKIPIDKVWKFGADGFVDNQIMLRRKKIEKLLNNDSRM